MSAAIVPLPGAGPYAGNRSHRAKLAQRREREILLACIKEHQKYIAKHQAAIASRNADIGELLGRLRELDGYRTYEREVNWPWNS